VRGSTACCAEVLCIIRKVTEGTRHECYALRVFPLLFYCKITFHWQQIFCTTPEDDRIVSKHVAYWPCRAALECVVLETETVGNTETGVLDVCISHDVCSVHGAD
jgi:hypothetical protein